MGQNRSKDVQVFMFFPLSAYVLSMPFASVLLQISCLGHKNTLLTLGCLPPVVERHVAFGTKRVADFSQI